MEKSGKVTLDKDEYPIRESDGGLFVVLELRNRKNHSKIIEEDRKLFHGLANLLNIKRIYYEQLDENENKRKKKVKLASFKRYLDQVASHANDKSNEIDYLLLFVLATSENVESSKTFEFFDNNSDIRMELTLSEILRPFLANVCDGLKDKPKVVVIHAPERTISQPKTSVEKPNIFSTPNHADFYLCISRPNELSPKSSDSCANSSFLKLLYSVLHKFPEYEINQVMSVLHRETSKHSTKEVSSSDSESSSDSNETSEEKSEVKPDPSLRLWNSSRLRKKLYLRSQEKTE